MSPFNFGPCLLENTKSRIIVLHEKKCKLTINNTNQQALLKVQVDGCLVFPGSKCDWLIVIEETNVAFFVELKGHDIDHGLDQLCNSIQNIENRSNGFICNNFSEKKCLLIVFRSPKSSPEIQKAAILFKKRLNATLIVKGPIYKTCI